MNSDSNTEPGREEHRKKIKLAMSNDENKAEKNGADDDVNVLLKNVFENDLILRNICQDFDLLDLKNFRSVCWKWKKASEMNFKDKARAVCSLESLIKLIEDFDKFYGTENEEIPCEIPITALTIMGKDKQIQASVLINFFSRGMGRFITDLKLDEISLAIDRTNSTKYHFNISKMIPRAVNKLQISPRILGETPKIYLKMRALQNVEYIDLVGIKLKFHGQKLVPIELKLHYVKFFLEDGTSDETLLLNNYVDLKNLKILSYTDSLGKLDMIEKDICLNLLRLHSTQNLVNWSDSNWKINKAIFSVEDNIQNLEIKHLESPSSRIDLYNLPKSVEEVSFTQAKRIKSSLPAELPNLKVLKVKCPNDLRLRVSLAVILIPPSVTTLELENNVVITGNEVFELDSLVIRHFNPWALLKALVPTLEKLKPKHLMLPEDLNAFPNAKDELLKIFSISQFCQRVSLGKEEWSIESRMRMRILQYFFIQRG